MVLKKRGPNEVCGKCNHALSDMRIRRSSDQVGCDGHCKKWFHASCVRISEEDFAIMSVNQSEKWFCELCAKLTVDNGGEMSEDSFVDAESDLQLGNYLEGADVTTEAESGQLTTANSSEEHRGHEDQSEINATSDKQVDPPEASVNRGENSEARGSEDHTVSGAGQEIRDNSSSKSFCNICKMTLEEKQKVVQCNNQCDKWFHTECVKMKKSDYDAISKKGRKWTCNACRIRRLQNTELVTLETGEVRDAQRQTLRWGSYNTEEEIYDATLATYKEIATWLPNLFMIPTGKEGKEFLNEVDKTLQPFIERSPGEHHAITASLIIFPLLLQKPSKKSKTRDHKKHLKRRLELWRQGNLSDLVRECKQIQKRLHKKRDIGENQLNKVFSKLMLQGKVSAAMKWITTNVSSSGAPLDINEDVLAELRKKHPDPQPAADNTLIQGPQVPEDPTYFDQITDESIYIAAKNLKGSAGPSGLNSDGIKRALCSKAFGTATSALCDTMARVARRICTEELNPKALSGYNSCRLIPLDKNPGIRPIGISEVIRRIIGKAIMKIVKNEVIETSGSFQVCSGHPSGSEAAIHAISRIHNDDATEATMLVDATNAFNCLNREAALQNVKILCPALSVHQNNVYGRPANLFIRGENNQATLKSQEGTTQGDPTAMGWYAISTLPMISFNNSHTQHGEHQPADVHQAWFADDATASGKLKDISVFWENITKVGPNFGYFPNPRKTVIIVKPSALEEAEELFKDQGIQITTDGKRHLGAVLGKPEFRDQYVSSLVNGWCEELSTLAAMAETDPQSAHSAFTHGMVHKWSFFQRTIPSSASLYQPLEDIIRNELLPKITGRGISDLERALIALPCRLGGLGIPDPTKTADDAYSDSLHVTEPLMEKIINKDPFLDQNTLAEMIQRKKRVETKNDERASNAQRDLLRSLPDHLKRLTLLNSERGASIWLTTLPLLEMGFHLNKQAFTDALCLRYDWPVQNMPSHCACGSANTINHALICHKGGYIIKRHNEIRDLEAELLSEVCSDATIEPRLLPLTGEAVMGIQSPDARLDVSAV